MSDRFELHYVTTYDSTSAPLNDIPKAPIHLVQPIATLTESGVFHATGNGLRCLVGALMILRKIDPVAVICVGSSIAVPLCICAKLLRKKAVFIESFTRVSVPSRTGTILSRFRLCDRIYVQWPDAERLYRGAVFRGMVI